MWFSMFEGWNLQCVRGASIAVVVDRYLVLQLVSEQAASPRDVQHLLMLGDRTTPPYLAAAR